MEFESWLRHAKKTCLKARSLPKGKLRNLDFVRVARKLYSHTHTHWDSIFIHVHSAAACKSMFSFCVLDPHQGNHGCHVCDLDRLIPYKALWTEESLASHLQMIFKKHRFGKVLWIVDESGCLPDSYKRQIDWWARSSQHQPLERCFNGSILIARGFDFTWLQTLLTQAHATSHIIPHLHTPKSRFQGHPPDCDDAHLVCWSVAKTQLYNTIYMYCNQTSGYKRFLLRYEKRNSAGKWFIRTSFDYCHHRISKCHTWLLEKGVQGEFNGSIGKKIWYI